MGKSTENFIIGMVFLILSIGLYVTYDYDTDTYEHPRKVEAPERAYDTANPSRQSEDILKDGVSKTSQK